MGFWGAVLVARSDAPLSALRSVQALGGDHGRDAAGSNGWRILKVHQPEHAGEADFRAIADEIGGPVLAAYVLDSDTAAVHLVSPRRGPFRRRPATVVFFLDEESAHNYDLPVDERAQATAPEAVVAWAGCGDVEAVRAAVAADRTFAEDSVLALAAAFGAIPAGELSEWTFGDD